MVKVLANIGNQLPAFGTSVIVAATLRWCKDEFIGSPANSYCVRPQSKAFVDYQRGLTGVPDTYAAVQ